MRSPSTATTDRRERRLGYRTLAGLEGNVPAHRDRVAVEVYRRQGDLWSVIEHGPGERIALRCIGFETDVDARYRGTGVASAG